MNQDLMQQAVNECIHTRRSVSVLVEPAPNASQIEEAVACALRAPDHRQLAPWQFFSISGDALESFGTLLVQAQQELGVNDAEKLAKVAKHPSRAPLIIMCITKVQSHEKVPEFEQLLAGGAAIQNMLLSFESMGYNTMWRSGNVVHSNTLKQAFGASEDDYVAGIVYVGTAQRTPTPKLLHKVENFLQQWP